MNKKNKQLIYIGLLLAVSILLFCFNYKSNTFLVGWDNLYPELNFKANFKRNIFAIWQEYRGLGVEDGMAYAANLVHTAFLWFLSFFLPLNILRYFFHFFLHFLGGLGIFLLLKNTFNKDEKLSFVGALFYEFNLATIQTFYAPLEAFSVHFAALPWSILIIYQFLKEPSKKNLLLFFIISFLFTPQGFIPPLFIAYFILIFSFLFIYLINNKFKGLKNAILIVLVIIITNSFWILPFIHAAKNQGSIIKSTKINQLSSEEIFEKNKKRGTLFDLLYLRGFMLDITENSPKGGKLNFIMEKWTKHIHQPIIFLFATVFSLSMLVGLYQLIKTLLRKQDKSYPQSYFLPAFFIFFTVLATNIPFFSFMNSAFRKSFPILAEAFRFPFTKFLPIYAFLYTIFLVQGLEIIIKKMPFLKKNIALLLIFISVILYAFPAFKGNFFYEVLRLEIPKEYFQVIDYFKNEPSSSRIMTLPQTTFWNWPYYSWGMRGSGFLWYGIEQSTLERPFDPWSNYNEQYFNEIFYALQTENDSLFQNVINKYKISYVLIDGNINHHSKIQLPEKLGDLIEKLYPQAEKNAFGNILVYKLFSSDYVSLKQNPASIGSSFDYEFIDQSFKENNDYIYNKDNWTYYYLFPALFTNKTQENLEFSLKLKNEEVILSPKEFPQIMDEKSFYYLNFEPFEKTEFFLPCKITLENKTLVISPIVLNLKIGNQEIYIKTAEEEKIRLSNEIDKISINDEPLNPNKTNYTLLYTNLPNSIKIFDKKGNSSTSQLTLSVISQTQQIPLSLKVNEKLSIQARFPLIKLNQLANDNLLEQKTYQIENPYSEEIEFGLSLFERETITFKTRYSANYLHQYLSDAKQQTGVFIFIDANNLTGLPLRVYIDNSYQQINFLETKLNNNSRTNILLLPPTSKYLYTGYGIHFRNYSPGTDATTNKLNSIKVGYLPYLWLRSLKIIKGNSLPVKKTYSLPINYIHQYPFIYKFVLDNSSKQDEILTISQAFSPSWIAWSNGKRLKDHVLVNNWENGWRLRSDETGTTAPKGTENIVIVFWPQYLEFLGFGLLIFAFLLILGLPHRPAT